MIQQLLDRLRLHHPSSILLGRKGRLIASAESSAGHLSEEGEPHVFWSHFDCRHFLPSFSSQVKCQSGAEEEINPLQQHNKRRETSFLFLLFFFSFYLFSSSTPRDKATFIICLHRSVHLRRPTENKNVPLLIAPMDVSWKQQENVPRPFTTCKQNQNIRRTRLRRRTRSLNQDVPKVNL